MLLQCSKLILRFLELDSSGGSDPPCCKVASFWLSLSNMFQPTIPAPLNCCSCAKHRCASSCSTYEHIVHFGYGSYLRTHDRKKV